MISIVISAYNEEGSIGDAIDSARDLGDEIIVVNNSSLDKTSQIAKEKGAKVFTQKNDPLKIDLQKNFGFSKATEPWILSLDADERLTPKLILEIKKTLEKDADVSGYYIPRKNIIFGKWIKHSLWWPDYQLRLFKSGKGKFNKSSVHMPVTIKGEVRHLSEPFLHESYISVSQYVTRMNSIYTEVEAEKIVNAGKRLTVSQTLTMPAMDFMKTFFLQKGYRDGMHGLMLSTLQAFYMFLVTAKVWEKQGFYEKEPREVLAGINNGAFDVSKGFSYWMTTAQISETRNPLKRAVLLTSKKFMSIFS